MIKEIEYREARLISTAQFENARIEFGVVYTVDDRGLAVATQDAKEYVRSRLLERIMEITERAKNATVEETYAKVARKYGL